MLGREAFRVERPKTQACAGGLTFVWDRLSPDRWFSDFLAVPQHFVCPLELCYGESGKHPPLQFVASANTDLREPPSLLFHTIRHLFCANFSWTARKHDFEKGKPF